MWSQNLAISLTGAPHGNGKITVLILGTMQKKNVLQVAGERFEIPYHELLDLVSGYPLNNHRL